MEICRDAKVSVLDWDANTNTIRPTSLHSFEGDAFVSASMPASPYGPRLLSDPQVSWSILIPGLPLTIETCNFRVVLSVSFRSHSASRLEAA